MIRRTPLKRNTKPIPRYVRVKRSRGRRRGPWRSEKYRRWIASQPCVICGHPDTQAAHTVRGGMSMKGTDASCVPLCYPHHMAYDAGRARFDVEHCTDLYQVSVQLFAIWEQKQKGKAA